MGFPRPDIFPAPKKQVQQQQQQQSHVPDLTSSQLQQQQQQQNQQMLPEQQQLQQQQQQQLQYLQQMQQAQQMQQQQFLQMQQYMQQQQQQQQQQHQYTQPQPQSQPHIHSPQSAHQGQLPPDVTSFGYMAQQLQQQKQQQFLSQLRTQQYLQMAQQVVAPEPKLGPSDIPIESIPLSIIHAAQEKQGYRYGSEDQQKYADLLFAQQWEIASRQHLKEKEEQRAWQLKLADLAAQSAYLTEQFQRTAAGLPPVGIPPQSEEYKQQCIQQLCDRQSIIALNPPPGYPCSSPTYVPNPEAADKKRKSKVGCARRVRQTCC